MPPLRELVQRARSGDLTACGEIVDATRAAAYAVAAAVLRDHASAEDAVQEAYLRAFRRLDDLERLAMLRYGIDDIRKIDVASVA